MYLRINSGCICTNTLPVHNQSSIPFNSKKDQEITKWAKLCGIGSILIQQHFQTSSHRRSDFITFCYYHRNTHIFDMFAKPSTFPTKTLMSWTILSTQYYLNGHSSGATRFCKLARCIHVPVIYYWVSSLISQISWWPHCWWWGDYMVYADEDMIRIYHDMNTGKWRLERYSLR